MKTNHTLCNCGMPEYADGLCYSHWQARNARMASPSVRLREINAELLAVLGRGVEIANRVFQMGDGEVRRALQEIYRLNRDAIDKVTGGAS